MKIRKLTLALAAALTAFASMAQGGYQDGIDYYNADRYEKAKIILNNTLNEPGTNKALAYYYLGAIDLRNNDTNAAKANFDRGVAADAKCAFNYVGLGEIALKGGDKAGAKDLFDQALKINKKDADVQAAIARAYFNVDPVAYGKEINKYITQALKDSKNSATSVFVLQGDMAAARHEIGQAASSYESAIATDEANGIINPEAYVKYANLYNNTTDPGNKSYAIAKLEELKTKLPTSALALSELAEKYYDAELYSKAAAAYREYMTNPNHFQQDEQRLAQLLYFDNKNQESLDIALAILAKEPNNPYMNRIAMLNYAAMKNPENAVVYGQKLFATPGIDFTALDYRTYGDALSDLQRYDEAIKMFEAGLSAHPDKNKDMLADISSIYNSAGNYAKAAEYQQKFVDAGDYKLNDLFTLANRYRNLALSLPEGSAERREAAQQGLKNIDLALESAAESSKAPLLRNKAVLLQLRDGQEPSQEIADTYIEMLKIYDADPANIQNNPDVYKSAYAYLAAFYNSKNDKTTARTYYEKLYQLAPETPGLAEFLKKY